MSDEYGIMGYPLTHSFSPAYFKRKFEQEGIDASYSAFPLHETTELSSLLNKHPQLKGLSVTIPYKETVIEYMDSLSDVAKNIRAVNCIAIRDGKMRGHNTDVIGFEKSLRPLLKSHHQHALILGTGGASKAVAYVLDKLNIGYRKVSREKTGHLNYEALSQEIIETHNLIINTTPLGMFPHTENFPPLPYDAVGEDHLLYDLIYNPEETKFLAKAREKGASTKNGFEMLEIQAEESWKIWNS